MPLWRIFAHPDVFDISQREALAKDITKLYAAYGLPPFYVNVIFIDVPETGLYIGGVARRNFVRIVVEQIARTLESAKMRAGWMEKVNEVLKPHIEDRGDLDWEHHISETPRDLWRVQGLVPPPTASEEENLWFDRNKPVPYLLKL